MLACDCEYLDNHTTHAKGKDEVSHDTTNTTDTNSTSKSFYYLFFFCIFYQL